ncbi:hypothetical protein [Treponema bryantii]|uniref:hypothetical protein n=1 Tax=Treponema bryantii TaxID=163 RepID=UPI0003B6AEE9|nr:hypothetical protein [Treponema bryantii]
MKKILIASSCAFMLCFTSCASKQAPESESQIEAPATESTEAKDNSAQDNNQADAEENSSKDTETQADEESIDENDSFTSEDFPEPETIEEPEIITLEAPVEPEPSENEPASEEVKNEEPPEITVVNSNEENQTAESEETGEEKEDLSETSETPSQEEDKDLEDITANDVVIVSKQDSDGISGGIDITDDDSDSAANLSDIEKDITPSRSVTLKKFEYLDVTYPGTGWIYMGLTDNSKDLAYFGRKLGTKDTKFSLQARAAGTKIIHFYRNDPLTGQYLDDYVEVIIQAENGSNKTHIEAPEYKLPVQKKVKPAIKATEEETPENTEEKEADKKTEASPARDTAKAPVKTDTSPAATERASAQTVNKTSNAVSATKENVNAVETQASQAEAANTVPATNPDTLLKEAQVLYNEKEYSAALNKLKQFFEYSTDNGDEALYLKGQILEAKSDVRDIKGAIDAYTTLTKNYPASKLWDSANKRIIYLKRFYLEVR